MSERKGFYRKVVYGVLIAALWFPLSLMSAPATVESEGGKLAQLRDQYDLGQADLGEINAESETMKLATLGLRGVAATLLWQKANHYKKVEDWTNLTTTLEQLAKIQPNYITFWKFQSWNLSYNVSVEFDDYHDRYYWVIRGIEFLTEGNKYNRDNPALLWELGWVNGHKIGRADEKKQYRRLYKADNDFHEQADRPPSERDNWLVAKRHYEDAVDAVDVKRRDLGKKSPALFYSSPSKAMMSYAEAIEGDGLFERAIEAWRVAGDEWREYGDRPIEHSQGYILRFNDYEELTARAEEVEQELKSLVGGIEERIIEEAKKGLTEEQLAAHEKPVGERTDEEWHLAAEVDRALNVSPDRIAAAIADEDPELKRKANELAAELIEVTRLAKFTNNYKDTTNYDYWKLRCEFEQTDEAVQARELVYRAELEFKEQANPVAAKELYEQAFHRWAAVFEKYPKLKDPQGTTGDDVMFILADYKRVLDQLDETIPEDFPLWEIIENFDSENKFAEELRERNQNLAGGVEVDDAEEQGPEAEGSSVEATEESPEADDTEPNESTSDSGEASDETSTDAAE